MTLADRLIDLNRWYEGLPDGRRIFVYPAVLVAAGFVNTRWTGAPIGWVSVSALLALIAARRCYVSGWLTSGVTADGPTIDTKYRAATEQVALAVTAKSEPVRPAPVLPRAEPAVAAVAERKAAEPAPVHAHVIAPASVSPAVQPIARAVPERVVPVQDAAEAKPVARAEAATAMPPSPQAHDNQAKSGKRGNTSSGRKHEGKSGKRKPGDKHS